MSSIKLTCGLNAVVRAACVCLCTGGVNRISRGSDNLTHVTPPNEDLNSLKKSVIEEAVREGSVPSHHLHHVQPPKEGVSELVRQAYLEDHKDEQKRKATPM